MKKTQNKTFSNTEIKKMTPSEQPFSKTNYWLMAGCAFLIVIGFLLMLGGGSSVEEGFNPDIFSTRRIVVGPLLAFLGFLFMAFAILVEPAKLRRYLKREKGDKTVKAEKAESTENTVITEKQDSDDMTKS